MTIGTVAKGKHDTFGEGACALEWVDHLDRTRRGETVGEDTALTDGPECACPVIAAFVRPWQDGIADDESRTRLLRDLIPRLLDTRSTPEVERRRALMCANWAVRVAAPLALEACGRGEDAATLRALAPIVDVDTARAARAACLAASCVDDADDAAAAADYAADYAARACACACAAAHSAANANDAAAGAYAAAYAERAAAAAARAAAAAAVAARDAHAGVGGRDLIVQLTEVTSG